MRTLEQFRASVPSERFALYRQVLRERLGLDVERTPMKLLDSSEVARLAGVTPGTVTQWKRRTRLEETPRPFITPSPESFPEKDLYDPVLVCLWLDWARKWPPPAAARPETRGPRRERATAGA